MTIEGRHKKVGRLIFSHTAIDVVAVLSIVLFGVIFRRELSEQMAFYWPTLATVLHYFAVSISFRKTISGRLRAIVSALLFTVGVALVMFPGRGLFAPEASDLFLGLYLLLMFAFLIPIWWLYYFMFGWFVRRVKQSIKNAGE